MKRYYCTYFDRNYLVKALALHQSLLGIPGHDFELFVVCLDELTFKLLPALKLPHLKLISLQALEEAEPQLVAIKPARTLLEYYWTLTPVVVNRILEDNPHVDILTYVDADLYFFSTPEPLFSEMAGASVLICEHKFSPEVAHVAPTAGTYNVGLVSFRSDAAGYEVLRSWRSQCLEWCQAVYKDGKYGDQLYLNDWPERFKQVAVCQTYGAAIGPWNHTRYRFAVQNGQITVDGRPLVFYHYHALYIIQKKVFLPAVHLAYKLRTDCLRDCFVPYLEALENAIARVTGLLPEFSFGLNADVQITDQHVLMMREDAGFADPLKRTPIALGQGWRGYPGAQWIGDAPVPGEHGRGPEITGADELNHRGEEALVRGDFDNAITWFVQALALAPLKAQFHVNIATAYARRQQFEKSRLHLEKARELSGFDSRPAADTGDLPDSSRPVNEWPKITLVTPSYNQGDYLEQGILSILDQRYPNLEYIIMDGGSNDGSVDIIKKYASHLTYWQSLPDKGQYAAVEAGFARGNGEIMTWLNSDDLLHPGALWMVAKIFMAYPAVEWITGRPTVFNRFGELESTVDQLPRWSRTQYLEGRFGPPHIQQESTYWRRSLYEKAGNRIETRMKLAGDCELWARFFRHAQLHTVDALFGGFRHHSAQKTSVAGAYEAEAAGVAGQERRYLEASADKTLLPAPSPFTIGGLIHHLADRITVDAFPWFTYSRYSHFAFFARYAQSYLGRSAPDRLDDLKVYQDLLLITFIRDVMPPGSKILEIGGGDSRVFRFLGAEYECWNLDKLEGVGNGPTEVKPVGFRLVQDYIGAFNRELPENYFDLVFSISALEHVPEETSLFHNICRDIDRLLKDNALSLHCFDIRVNNLQTWAHALMPFMMRYFGTITPDVPRRNMLMDQDAYFMTEDAYNRLWMPVTGRSYQLFGRPASYNVLWKKNDARTRYKQEDHYRMTREGEEAFHRGELPQARALFESALKVKPAFSVALNNLGTVQWQQGDKEAARKSFKDALIDDPSNRLAVDNALNTLDISGQYEHLGGGLWNYLDQRPDDDEIRAKLVAAHEAFLDGLLTRSTIIDKGYCQRSYLVTAVVPAHASGKWLAECLDSLEAQTLGETLEIIVVDDISSKKTHAVVQTFQERNGNIRYARSPGRISLFAAWNLGIRMARGAFVAPVSPGIRLQPDACKVLSDHLQSNGAAALVYGDKDRSGPPFSFDALLFGPLCLPHPLWRKAVHQSLGYINDQYLKFGDLDFCLRLGKRLGIVHIPCMSEIKGTGEGFAENPDVPMEEFEVRLKHQKLNMTDKGIMHTTEQFRNLMADYIEVIERLVLAREIQTALQFYKRHRALFPSLPEMIVIDAQITRLEISSRSRSALRK